MAYVREYPNNILPDMVQYNTCILGSWIPFEWYKQHFLYDSCSWNHILSTVQWWAFNCPFFMANKCHGIAVWFVNGKITVTLINSEHLWLDGLGMLRETQLLFHAGFYNYVQITTVSEYVYIYIHVFAYLFPDMQYSFTYWYSINIPCILHDCFCFSSQRQTWDLIQTRSWKSLRPSLKYIQDGAPVR